MFEIHWRAGEIMWLSYDQVRYLDALATYLELLGVDKVQSLPNSTKNISTDDSKFI